MRRLWRGYARQIQITVQHPVHADWTFLPLQVGLVIIQSRNTATNVHTTSILSKTNKLQFNRNADAISILSVDITGEHTKKAF